VSSKLFAMPPLRFRQYDPEQYLAVLAVLEDLRQSQWIVNGWWASRVPILYFLCKLMFSANVDTREMEQHDRTEMEVCGTHPSQKTREGWGTYW